MISVHAISMLYELRALRSRLERMIDHPALFVNPDELAWMYSVVVLMIAKTERTGEYIASLTGQDAASVKQAAEEARLGEGLHDGDADRVEHRCDCGRRYPDPV